MTRLSSRLLAIILPVLGLVWLISSGALYWYARHSLYERIDAELRVAATKLPLHSPLTPPDLALRTDSPDEEQTPFFVGSELFFQIWKENGQTLERSHSLLGEELQKRGLFEESPNFGEQTFSDGRKIRTLTTLRKPPPTIQDDTRPFLTVDFPANARNMTITIPADRRKPPPPAVFPGFKTHIFPTNTEKLYQGNRHVIIAKDLSSVEQTLSNFRVGIAASTLIGLLAATLAVRFAVKKGLNPISTLAHKVSLIESQSLDRRISLPKTLEELEPIALGINELLERLESAFERERQFGSDLAHEIRTPTAEIRALAEVGLTWPEQFGPAEIRSIHDSSRRIEGTTQALLDLTRIDSKAFPLQTAQVNLAQTTSEILEAFSNQARQKDLILLTELPSTEISAPQSLVVIIIQNLIGNAIAYAPPKTKISIVIRNSAFIVTNEAPKLSPEDLPLMFERFWRKDTSRTSPDHAGLGLRLVKVAAAQMHAQITPTLKDGTLAIEIQF